MTTITLLVLRDRKTKPLEFNEPLSRRDNVPLVPKRLVETITTSAVIRKVKFALKPIIIIFEDDEDRKGPWELFAVDRDRFNRRIRCVESKIGWCFEPNHREKIFNLLF
jgi:hypothetical protein